jgi:hemerythrin-like domain-containing protein
MLRHAGLIPLSQEHHQALALCVAIDRTLAADDNEATAARIAAQIVRKFDGEIREHFEFEERVLFPALAVIAELSTTVEELRTEHTLMIELVEKLRSNVDRGLAGQFSRALRNHVHKEERVLFEQAQQLLTGDELNAIGARRHSEQ